MKIEDLAGSRLWCAIPGPELGAAERRALRDVRPAGVILFARNLRSPAQVRDLALGIRELAGADTFVGIDQEGGRVNRLTSLDSGFERLPAARVQAGWGDEELRGAWSQLGACLRGLGIDVDFAPVVDLDDGDGANAIGPRAFGTDPAFVEARAALVLEGLREAGVAGCLKHFPGLGGTTVDTHHDVSVSPLALDELERDHARPYRTLADAAPFVMTSHASYPAVDGPDAPPATFSPTLLRTWLRERFGYSGLVISDDLGMQAVARRGAPGALAIRTLAAGADHALFCGELDAPRRARDDVAEALLKGDLDVTDAQRTAECAAALRDRLRLERDGSYEAARAELFARLGASGGPVA